MSTGTRQSYITEQCSGAWEPNRSTSGKGDDNHAHPKSLTGYGIRNERIFALVNITDGLQEV